MCPAILLSGLQGDRGISRRLERVAREREAERLAQHVGGVRLVVAGGAPGYQRFRKGRLTYVAGTVEPLEAKRFPPCPRGYPRRVAAKLPSAFLYVAAAAGRAQAQAVGLDGKTIDRFRVG